MRLFPGVVPRPWILTTAERVLGKLLEHPTGKMEEVCTLAPQSVRQPESKVLSNQGQTLQELQLWGREPEFVPRWPWSPN